MKRWTLTVVALVSAFALIATPALAATQTQAQDRYQDGTCTDCPEEMLQLRLRSCEGTQTQAGEMVQVRSQAQTGEMTQFKAQARTGKQTQAGEMVQAQTQTQAGEMVQAHAAEWVQKLLRHQNRHAYKYAKCLHVVESSD